MLEKNSIDDQVFKGTQENYDAIQAGIEKLSRCSEKQFESIKKEEWYNRVFDMVTFSQKGKIRLAEQITSLSQAQQILIELLVRLSEDDVKISQLVAMSMNDICRMQEQNIYLLDRINKLENISLGIKADTDLNRLTEKEKKILSGCLYIVSQMNAGATENQKFYADTVLSYIGVNVQMEGALSVLDGLDNESKKCILTCCMEYMFLKDCTCDFDEYEDFIQEFDFGSKTVKSIENNIKALFNLRGINGFFSKYRMENYELIDDYFELDIDMGDMSSKVSCEEQEKMTDEIIFSIIQVSKGEQRFFKNKNIHINSYINCDGDLIIDHCVLHYNETKSGNGILLNEGANLKIVNSTIICKGFDKKTFIKSKGANDILFENCYFIDCSNFICSDRIEDDYSGKTINFCMKKCKLKNCYTNFIFLRPEEESACDISNNLMMSDGISSFNKDEYEEWYGDPVIIKVETNNKVMFHNNIVKAGKKANKTSRNIKFFACDSSTVYDCDFVGVSFPVISSEIKSCKFEECDGCVTNGAEGRYRGLHNQIIDNCLFKKCKNVIYCGDGVQITNCQFISCKDYIIKQDPGSEKACVKFCEFINITNNQKDDSYELDKTASIIFTRGKSENINYMEKCIFDGIEMNKNFLIAAPSDIEPWGDDKTVAYIENCSFSNCSTKRKDRKIIKEDSWYKETRVFRKDEIVEYSAIVDIDCYGLENINKEGKKASNKTINEKKVGSNLLAEDFYDKLYPYIEDKSFSDVNISSSNSLGRKSSANKSVLKATTKKTAATTKKTATTKPTTKKSTAKTASTKSTTKKSTAKTASTKSAAKKSTAKTASTKSAAKKSTAKRLQQSP